MAEIFQVTFHINSVSLLDQAPGGLAGIGAERKTIKNMELQEKSQSNHLNFKKKSQQKYHQPNQFTSPNQRMSWADAPVVGHPWDQLLGARFTNALETQVLPCWGEDPCRAERDRQCLTLPRALGFWASSVHLGILQHYKFHWRKMRGRNLSGILQKSWAFVQELGV